MTSGGPKVLLVVMCLLISVAVGSEIVRYEYPELGLRISVPASWLSGTSQGTIALGAEAEAAFTRVYAFTDAVGGIQGLWVKVLQPPQPRHLFELPLEAVAEQLFTAANPAEGSILEHARGTVWGSPATVILHRRPSGHPGRDVFVVWVTVRGSNTIYVLVYYETARDPWSMDRLLEWILRSFELDPWAALERGDYAIAYHALLPAAEQGHRLARAWIGHLHEHGLGVEQDDGEALRWYRLAAGQGCAFSRDAAERLAGAD